MNKINVIWHTNISEQDSNYLQATFYEMVGARNLAAYASVNMPEAYEKLRKDYVTALAAHELMFEEIKRKYVPKEYYTERYHMNVIFSECELRIEDWNV